MEPGKAAWVERLLSLLLGVADREQIAAFAERWLSDPAALPDDALLADYQQIVGNYGLHRHELKAMLADVPFAHRRPDDEREQLLAGAAWAGLQAYSGRDATAQGRRYAAAVAVLAAEADDELARLEDAARRVADALEPHMARLVARVRGLTAPTLDAPDGRPVFAWDHALCEVLRGIGPTGAQGAAEGLTLAADRWGACQSDEQRSRDLLRLWLVNWQAADDVRRLPMFVRVLARAVWVDDVRPKILSARRYSPALPMAVHEGIGETVLMPARRANDQQAELRLGGYRLVPVLDVQVIDELARAGQAVLGTVTAAKLVTWIARAGHASVAQPSPRADDSRITWPTGGGRIVIHGAERTLADELALGTREMVRARQLIEHLHAVQVTHPDFAQPVRLLMREERIGRRTAGRTGPAPRELTLILGSLLLPGYVNENLAELGLPTRARQRAKRLVPVLDGDPPLVGDRSTHAAQWRLSWGLLEYLRDHAEQLLEDGPGGVLLDLSTFAHMAHHATLRAGMVGAVLDRWTQDGDDAPKLLERVERDRYTLGPTHAGALDTLRRGARQAKAGAAGRAKAAKARATAEAVALGEQRPAPRRRK